MKNNIKIAGEGFISSGEYENVIINGSANSSGDVKADKVKINGNAYLKGNLEPKYFKVNGDSFIKGGLISEYVKIAGDLRVEGKSNIGDLNIVGNSRFNCDLVCNNVTITGDLSVKGNLSAKEVKVYGNIKIEGDIECENILIKGAIECGGLCNAEKIDIYLRGNSYCKDIGATNINVLKYDSKSLIKIPSIISRGFECDTIEGDFIKLENSDVTNIRGKDISLLSNCNVESIEYNSNLNISNNSTVKSNVKIG